MDVVLGCRSMNNPSQGHLDISSSEDEQSSPSATTAISQVPNQGEQEEDSMIGDSGASAADESNLQSSDNSSSVAATACKRPPVQKRRGRKTKLMEAMERGIDRLIQHDHESSTFQAEMLHERERFTWEKELQQARLELDKARLDFEVKRLEAEERRAQESRQIMVQFLQLLKPPMPYYGSAPPYNSFHGAVPPGHVADLMFPSGAPMPPAPSAVPQHNQVDWLNLQNPQ